MVDFLIVGHVVKDRFPDEDDLQLPGGTAYYATLALCSLGARVAVLTRVAPSDDRLLLNDLRLAGAAVTDRESAASTEFVHEFPFGRGAERVMRLVAQAEPLTELPPDLPPATFGYAGPLMEPDVPVPTLAALRSVCGRTAIDLQGLVRHAEDGAIALRRPATIEAALGLVDVLKADLAEAEVVTGEDEPEAAARALAALGPQEVIITMNDRGSVVLAGGELVQVPALEPVELVDPTGCGDTYLAAYLFARTHGGEVRTAAFFAAAAAACKLEQHGALRVGADAVRDFLVRHTRS